MTKSMNGLLHHYLEVMMPSIFPIRKDIISQNEWIVQLAFSEPRVLYAVLACASAEMLARTGQLKQGSPETTYREKDIATYNKGDVLSRMIPDFVDYKVKAIKILNEKMSIPEQAIETPTVYAIIQLLGIEIVSGNAGEIAVHLDGLRRLLYLRGGYHGLPATVLEIILTACYMVAIMTETMPLSPPPLKLRAVAPSTSALIADNTDPHLQSMAIGILDAEVRTRFSAKLIEAFQDLREVTLYREFFHTHNCRISAAEDEYFVLKSYHLRYVAISIPFDDNTSSNEPKMLGFQEACRLALLIFWNANLMSATPSSAFFRYLTTALKAALEKSELKTFWHPNTDLLMWVLFLGAHISAGQSERPWYVLNLARGSWLKGLREKDDFRALLMRFYYIDRVYAKSLQDIWEEVKMVIEVMQSGMFG